MNPEDRRKIARINEISALARTSWIGLLAYLAFVFVTLLGVEDADFFVPSRQTQLPLINVSIPTASFFIFAPVLAAALYVYLHLFLIKLWDAIAEAPSTIRTDPQRNERIPLSDAIHPWLANDLATGMRGDGARPEPDRPLRWLSTVVTWTLVWISGPFVLLMLWWWSAPAHNEGLTLLTALCLFVATVAGSVSWFRARARLRGREPALWRRLARWAVTAVFGLALVTVSMARTEGGLERWAAWSVEQAETLVRPDAPFHPANVSYWRAQGPMPICFDQYGVSLPPDMIRERHLGAIGWLPGDENRMIRTARRLLDRWLDDDWLPLARTDLSGEALGAAPPDWLDHDIARRRAREAWCKGRGISLEACDLIATDIDAAAELWCEEQDAKASCPDRFRALVARFDDEWRIDRAAYLDNLTTLDLSGRDLRQADLADAFLSASSLRSARMEGADLSEARMEGADLGGARMEGADLRKARMEGADLSGARMEGSDLFEADLRSTNWAGVRVGSSAWSVDLRGAKGLTQSQLDQMIGDSMTLLPETLDDGSVPTLPSCWPAPGPAFLELLIADMNDRWQNFDTAENIRSVFLCPKGEEPARTGTPLALDAPYPDGHPLADRED